MKTFERDELCPCLCDMKDIMWYDYMLDDFLPTLQYEYDDVYYGDSWLAFGEYVFSYSPNGNRIEFNLLHSSKNHALRLEDVLMAMSDVAKKYNDEDDEDFNYCYHTFNNIGKMTWAIGFWKPKKNV